jgi:hypothetical protein
MASETAQRLGGVLLTDERSASEAVMIMWLAAGDDSALAAALEHQLIVGAVHISRTAQGVKFDGTSVPVLAAPGGIAVERLDEADLSENTQNVLRRLKARLKSGEENAIAAVMGVLADHLAFFVFAKGSEPIGAGWTVDYAGRTYPLKPA